ncbi:MAG: Nucleotide sugar epimerase [Candidatus Azambacteria bacterium GW2011_GWC1_46_13]|uniref:Nucleotide sugar epimerase n=1 Tax=Candidatus Azambacteria bacterium GW2011_GWC1_46_13 TaxID=1618619 RepID=A0A0G1QT13_9BACT|nr:MAG: Nucleotide sugar epimerase [Candidatus Azambacteria bacterium GW2011_GWC1_46_13]
MNLLVTGGAGFIGSHLVDELVKQGHKIKIIDNLSTGRKEYLNPGAEFFELDIRDFEKIRPVFDGVEMVFHLAAQPRIQPSIANPRESNGNNIDGTLNVLVAARDAGVKKVIVCLRYFNVYGPRQPLEGAYATVIGIFLRQKAKGEPLTIVGDGEQTRDFTYVGDIVRANILASENPKAGGGEVINIGSGKNYSINQIASFIDNPTVNIPPRDGEARDTLADIGKAKELLGWEPRVHIEEGIKNCRA